MFPLVELPVCELLVPDMPVEVPTVPVPLWDEVPVAVLPVAVPV
jgi:hypothetical protein